MRSIQGNRKHTHRRNTRCAMNCEGQLPTAAGSREPVAAIGHREAIEGQEPVWTRREVRARPEKGNAGLSCVACQTASTWRKVVMLGNQDCWITDASSRVSIREKPK